MVFLRVLLGKLIFLIIEPTSGFDFLRFQQLFQDLPGAFVAFI
jgi:hypothetical protein